MKPGALLTDPERQDEPKSALRSAGMLLTIPTLLIVSPLVGFFLGRALDRWWKTTPWISLVGLALGFAAAGRETMKIYRRYLDEEDRSKRR